jgi:DNA invertase Pin-like site-specific DNA recombinase
VKLVAYVRVSTIGQVREGYGLDAQRADIRTWAKANHHRIMLWCSDEGVSGANGVDRRYDLKLWIGHPLEGAAYLPS